jgi:hypothetical protein
VVAHRAEPSFDALALPHAMWQVIALDLRFDRCERFSFGACPSDCPDPMFPQADPDLCLNLFERS